MEKSKPKIIIINILDYFEKEKLPVLIPKKKYQYLLSRK